MKKKLIILFVFWGCLVSSAFAYPFNTQTTTLPAYQFQSTSTCPSTVGASSYVTSTVYAPCSSAPSVRPRKTGEYNPWDEDGNGVWDEGDPTGQQIGQVDTPIGEPLILLLMVVLYATRRYHKSRLAKK